MEKQLIFSEWLNEDQASNMAFQNAITTNPRDTNARVVYADYLQDYDLANEDTLNFLRFNPRKPTFINLPNGKVWAGYNFTIEEIKNISIGEFSDFFSPRTMKMFGSTVGRQAYNGPGGTYFVTGEKDANSQERMYNVRKFFMDYENKRHRISSISRHPDVKSANAVAKKLANEY